ncbi:hypothetical protein AALP_AA2G049500 [Arabis alpina]|uniref:Uncharacterized protein n=1 Tax=Arabis alpina TaxID=50452 RepID=A0A087HFE8_ARAAL|nr:hypothetical protein AALP_AA2G049500 [Arabis alpina]
MPIGKSERVADSCGDVLGVVSLRGSSNEIGKVRDTNNSISLLENQSTTATPPSCLLMVSLTVHLFQRSCLKGAELFEKGEQKGQREKDLCEGLHDRLGEKLPILYHYRRKRGVKVLGPKANGGAYRKRSDTSEDLIGSGVGSSRKWRTRKRPRH